MKGPLLNSLAVVAVVLLAAAGGPWLLAQLRSLPGPSALAARSGQRVVSLDVGGMTCAGCATRVREELSGVRGVHAAEVRLAQRKAFVVCERAVSDSALIQAIGRAGPGFQAAVANEPPIAAAH